MRAKPNLTVRSVPTAAIAGAWYVSLRGQVIAFYVIASEVCRTGCSAWLRNAIVS